jgi:predicted PurR-regulated permease PerM
MLFALFFLFKDGKQWLASLQEVIPLEASHKQRIIDRVDQTIRAVVKGIGVTAVVQGLLAGLAYGALGVTFPIVLTAVTVILAPLPFGGTAWSGGRLCCSFSWRVRCGKGWSCWVRESASCR